MGKSVWPVDGLLSVSQGLTEGDTEVAGLCPSVCHHTIMWVCAHLGVMYTHMSVLLD